ncbi:hydroxyisourate hydrolase [Aspergillus brunneoviolaceus CBS 621.78]|uniref:Hydroxyisourate hydrolase n=1 Tax=Aspergillus brunneoviolaceus CBS 621.78 TaxID=1450534 RepID=A0ACD1GC87_9EURO|nr:Hydroxyisourate hydrolase [Aspergillus brunneoviolaceus CBS 621.78]RAH46744.1 Hydroxyisourate hydrolase [Aspergillus brunneoviolaceus CBS 621.78]
MDNSPQPHQPSTGPIPTHQAQPTERLNLIRNQLNNHTQHSSSPSSSSQTQTKTTNPTPKFPRATMSRDPITCHVLNTLTGTPAANLPVTLTLLSSSTGSAATEETPTFRAITNTDGRVANWELLPTTTASSHQAQSVPAILAALPAPDSKTNWAVRFEVGPWYEAQGVESFWPEVEVKFTVKGRGKEGEEGWRHYHVPVLLGPWNYSTYRGS